MALGIGELDGCTRYWNTRCHSIFFFEHEIRRRPTDRREVITRITRIFFGTRISLTDSLLLMFEHESYE